MNSVYLKLKGIAPKTSDKKFIENIIINSRVLNVNKNEIIVNIGETNKNVFYIMEGSLIRKTTSQESEEVTIMFHHTNFMPFVKCVDSFYSNTKSQYFIQANEKSKLLEIKYDFIIQSLLDYPEVLNSHNEYFKQNYLITEQLRAKQLLLGKEKYILWLYKTYPDFFKIFSSKDLASFIGVTPEWFSKLKNKLFS